jgi:hypothetical protein
MLTLSLTEIRSRAQAFANDWAGETREHAEAKSFWDGFFQVFGRSRREVASFEDPVKKLTGSGKNFIDLLWKGVLLAEHKSAGKDLGKAESQAMGYIQELINSDRRDEVPRYVIVSDFARIALHDLETDTHTEIQLADLPKKVELFGFLMGMRQISIRPQDPVNIKAAERMAALHDAFLDGGYPADQLDQLLTRILFCLFSEDTQIFEANQFASFLTNHTRDDGSDLGLKLAQLFSVLNTPENRRQKILGEELNAFPYVNGGLFANQLEFAATDKAMRESLLHATSLDWSRISPAIFGSMFQGVMDKRERRQVGAHYTSETDILKVINPLFMDALREELAAIVPLKQKNEKLRRLRAFHDKLAELNFLDPACGCGNFLITAYRELRALETQVIKLELEMTGFANQAILDISILTKVRVSQFHGIEIGHFPAEIARVAMWLVDHQANMHLSRELGKYFLRLPLQDAANIVTGNALTIPWEIVISADRCAFIFGNPPFIGYSYQTKTQKEELAGIVGKIPSGNVLDYVAAWHLKATAFATGTLAAIGFVSTNSICQGEQAGILWKEIFARGYALDFAYQTFPWQSEARGKAAVHCVITGFSQNKSPKKRLFTTSGEVECGNINQYLVAAPTVLLGKQSKPLFGQTPMVIGGKPTEGGNLLLNKSEKEELTRKEPLSEKWMRPFVGSDEFINGVDRWCLWLVDCPPSELRQMPEVLKRIANVKEMREASPKPATKKLANTPSVFGEIKPPKSKKFLVVPRVSSERRTYVPIGYIAGNTICGDATYFVDDASPFTFGIITSQIHMAWMRTVCGRLKSDYRYNNTLVYNNFPWPTPTDSQKAAVEKTAQAVLDARAEFPDSSLADLYDPITMPPALAKAHADLDKAVDRCYQSKAFANDRERVELLFKLYEQLTSKK